MGYNYKKGGLFMRKAKKLIALLLCIIMFVSVFAGCNKNDTAISDTSSANFILDSSIVDETLSSETDSAIVDKTSSENTTKANSQKNNVSSEKVVSNESNNQVDNSTKDNVSNNTTSNNTINKLPLTVNWITTPKYTFNNIESTLDGKAWIGITKDSNNLTVNSKLIDEKGNQLYEADTMEQSSVYTDIIVVKKGSQYGMINTSGKVLIALQQYEIGFSSGHILIRGSDGLAHILDKNGNDTGETTIWFGWSGSSGGHRTESYLYDAGSDLFYDSYDSVFLWEDEGNSYYVACISLEMIDDYLEKKVATDLPQIFIANIVNSIGSEVALGDFKVEGYKGCGVFVNKELKSKVFYDSIEILIENSDWNKTLFYAGKKNSSGEIDQYFLTNAFGEKILNETFENIGVVKNQNSIPVKQNGKWGFISIPTL